MANYFNFQKITPAAPNDPVVNEVTQLNNNWDQLDTKLQPYMIGGSLTYAEAGQEGFDGSFRYAVWDGAALRIPDDIDANWSAWQDLPMASGKAIRTGYKPQWRSNSKLRIVQLSGGVQFDGSASAFPMGTSVLMTGDVSPAPGLSFLPLGGKHVCQAATALTAGTSVTAGAYIIADDQPGGSGHVRIHAQYLGGGGGGNFVMLDQVWWFY